MERTFAIGDIHGCSKTFEKLLFDKIKIEKTDQIYCIGDYIDRGQNSKAVIDLILQLRTERYTLFTLRGNHEQMLLDSLIDEEAFDIWIENGGGKTLQSFGIDSLENLPDKYLSFFNETQFYFETEKYIFAHAGLNFYQKNILQDKEAMLWIRDFSSYQPALQNKLLIHGHTPKSLKYIFNQKGNCIDIDGGCVYHHLAPFGNLVAIDLNDRRFIWEENCE
ncbi:MAG TPA: metallophosphoesterase family protein [Hanamia sp.]|nr:metallophosphoesterase family protein [Hanamia sp.]